MFGNIFYIFVTQTSSYSWVIFEVTFSQTVINNYYVISRDLGHGAQSYSTG